MTRTRPTRSSLRWPALAGVVLMLALAGCSGGAEDDSSSSSAGSAAQAEPAAGSVADSAEDSAAAAPEVAAAASQAESAADPVAPSIARTAQLVVRVPSLDSSVAKVRAAATTYGGSVASEVTDTESVLVLKVPEARLDAATDAVAKVGTLISRQSTADDVTGDLADLNSRLESRRRSVARVRDLMAKAEKLSDIVLLEGELSRRETELEATSARRAALADRAELATLTVNLQTPATKDGQDDDGFLAGLQSGWDALRTSTTVALTVLGAVLPFAAILAALALAHRQYQARRRPATPPPSATPPAAAPPSAAPPSATPPTGQPPAPAPAWPTAPPAPPANAPTP